MKKVILHVGLHKTATTSIQDSLFNNSMPSRFQQKYFYPKSLGCNQNYFILSMDCHYEYISGKLNFENLKEKLSIEVKRNIFETLVISAEFFFFLSEKLLQDFKVYLTELMNVSEIDFSVVIFVRNPVTYFNSLVQQLACDSTHLSDAEILSFCSFFSRESWFKKYINVFGKASISLFKFEDAVKHQYGPVGFFYENVLKFNNIDMKSINIKLKNESVSQIAADICLFINREFPNFNLQRTKIINMRDRHDLDLIAENITGEKFKLKKYIKYIVLDRFSKQLNELKNIFDIECSYDEIKRNIDFDTEPSHILTEKNLEEIDNIFPELDKNIKIYVIEYLRDVVKILNNERLIELTENLIKKLDNSVILQI